jgi:hypothetical protein
MSFHEKTNLATLVILSIVFGGYFAFVFPQFAGSDDVPSAGAIWGLMFVLTLLPLLLSTAVMAILAVFSPKEAGLEDERDRTIEMRADARAGFVLMVGMIGLMLLLVRDTEPFWLANALLVYLAAAELTKGLSRAIAYRRS